MQFAARRQIFPALEHSVLAAIVGDEAAGFLDQQYPGRGVPNVEIVLPESVEPARRDPGKIECGGPEAADAAYFRSDGAENARPAGDVAAAEMRNAGADQRFVKVAPGRYTLVRPFKSV